MYIDHSRLSAWDRVVVDTSSLMESGEAFASLIPAFRQNRARILVLKTVEREILKHLEGPDPELRNKASQANMIIRSFDAEGLVDFGNKNVDHNTHADQEILETVISERKNHDFLVLTNDRGLAGNLLELSKFESVKSSRRLDVAEVAADGRFEPCLLKQCSKCRKSSAITQEKFDRYGRCLCGECLAKMRAAKEEASASNVMNDGGARTADDRASGSHDGCGKGKNTDSAAEIDGGELVMLSAAVIIGGLIWAWWEGFFDY